jgi:hypothetical protein
MAATVERLARALGKEQGETVTRQALTMLGMDELTTPDDLLRFAKHLIETSHGDLVLESVSRALKVSAILKGAKDNRSPP